MRVGVVDLGTNSTRLLLADVDGGAVRELDRRLTITRLGEGVDSGRRILPGAIARVRNVLVDYRRAAEEAAAERVLAFGTSAVRDAENGEAFLGEIEWGFGFATRLLSGEEEARLTFRGVAAGRPVSGATLVVDVGGGSTELVIGDSAGIAFHRSLDVGCVRLTERFLAGDPPAQSELAACGAHVRALLAEHVPRVRPSAAIGVAGTVATLATLDLELDAEVPELVHGHVMTIDWLAEELASLACASVSELRARRGIHPDRAPVIVAGTIVVLEILRHLGLPSLEVSEHDVMHGAALVAAELPAASEPDAPSGAYTC
jgi:exopolyphosphatase/guanosine-5'-triphosphate,3'-diphosphate pyrophosphatase